MRYLVLVPVVLLLYVGVFGGAIALFVWLFDPTLGLLFGSAGPILLTSLLVAVLTTVLGALRKPVTPWLFLIVLGISVTAILVGITGVHTLSQEYAPDRALQRRLPVGTILNGDGVSVRIGDATGVALSDVLVVSHREIPTIKRYETATWNAEERSIVFPDGTAVSAQVFPEVHWWNVPPFIDRLSDEITFGYFLLDDALNALDRSTFDRLGIVWGTFVLALLGVWTPARLFRWPLLNVMIAVGYLRFILAVPGIVSALLETYSVPDALPAIVHVYPFTVVWAGIGLLLLALTLFLTPLPRWQREIGQEVLSP